MDEVCLLGTCSHNARAILRVVQSHIAWPLAMVAQAEQVHMHAIPEKPLAAATRPQPTIGMVYRETLQVTAACLPGVQRKF